MVKNIAYFSKEELFLRFAKYSLIRNRDYIEMEQINNLFSKIIIWKFSSVSQKLIKSKSFKVYTGKQHIYDQVRNTLRETAADFQIEFRCKEWENFA